MEPSTTAQLGEPNTRLRSEIQRYCENGKPDELPPRIERADLLEINNSKLLQSGKYSDLTIRCGSDVYHLHRSVVCRVEFFAASCDGGFKVFGSCSSDFSVIVVDSVQEGMTGVIELPDDDPPSIKRMINYLYTLDYSDEDSVVSRHDDEVKALRSTPPAQDIGDDSAEDGMSPPPDAKSNNDPDDDESKTAAKPDIMPKLMANALVYALGEKYNIPDLKILAESKFMGIVYDCPTADLSTIVETVYTTTPSSDMSLRSQLIDVCTNRLAELMENREFVETMNEHGSLASKLLSLEVRQRISHKDTKQKLTETKKKLVETEARLTDAQRILEEIVGRHRR